MTHDLPTIARRTPPAPLSWAYDVAPADPVVWRGMVPESTRHDLITFWHRSRDAGGLLPPAFDGDVPPAELVVPPSDYHPVVKHLLGQVADHFDVPFSHSSAQAVLARYPEGAGTEWHLDAVEGKHGSDRRTVSFTMLLNGAFDDGQLETDPGGQVELEAGDVCAFSSRTWHRVAPVRSGERFALIAFGGFGR
jgi:hypothetical protein